MNVRTRTFGAFGSHWSFAGAKLRSRRAGFLGLRASCTPTDPQAANRGRDALGPGSRPERTRCRGAKPSCPGPRASCPRTARSAVATCDGPPIGKRLVLSLEKPFAYLMALVVLLCAPVLASADSVTAKTYNRLTEAQDLMASNDVEGAVAKLKALLDEVKADTLDQALTLQMLGYAEMSAERFDQAITHLKRSLALNKLPEKVKYNVGYMVAQLHAAQNDFDAALAFAAEWFETLEAPSPPQMMFMANIYAQTQRYEEAVPYAERALAEAEAPRETWYQLLTAAYFELGSYQQAAATLQRMLRLWPDKSGYWEQLASVYLVLEDEGRALATLRLAWLNGALEKHSSIRSMVQLAVARGVPEHAARMVEAAFEENLLAPDAANLDLLANAWVAAQEHDSAIAAFTRMANLEADGTALVRAANLHIEGGRWESAEQTLRDALDLGLEKPGNAWLLLAIACAEQEKFGEGFAALRKARAFEDSRRAAGRWQSYIADMRKQYEWQRNYGG